MAWWHFINCGRWYITTLPAIRLHYLSASPPLFLFPSAPPQFSSLSCLIVLLLFNISPSPSFLYLPVSTTVITLKRTRGEGTKRAGSSQCQLLFETDTQRGRGDVQRETGNWEWQREKTSRETGKRFGGVGEDFEALQLDVGRSLPSRQSLPAAVMAESPRSPRYMEDFDNGRRGGST